MMGMLRLTFLTTDLAFGGAETQLVRLATRLQTRCWRVRFVSMLSPHAYLEELGQAGIPVDFLGIRRGVPDLHALFRLVGLLRLERLLVLTTFLRHANLLGRLARWLSGVPVVVSSFRNENLGGPVRDKVMSLKIRCPTLPPSTPT